MKKLSKVIVTSVMSVLCLMMLSMSAFAAAQGQNTTIRDYISTSDNVKSSIAGKFKIESEINEAKYGADWNYYTRTEGGTTKYYYIKASDESSAVNAINSVTSNNAANDRVTDITQGLEIQPDTDAAITAMSGFLPFLEMVLGVMTVLITIGMTIFSAFDICYIAFPVFRNKCEEAKQTGQGIMAGKQNKQTGETKLRFVSDDAQYAIVAADTTQSGKNPFIIYFTKRLISYMVLAVLLFILITGNVTVFTNLAIKLVSGIIELIGDL